MLFIESMDSLNEKHKEINHKGQKLSKSMKRQGHVTSRKPNNSSLSSEDNLAEKPKKGVYREPNSKKMDAEKFLSKRHKLKHIKEFNIFNESQDVISNDINFEISEDEKSEIDKMTHNELANLWRHGSSSDKRLQGKVGEYVRYRLFDHFGGFNPTLSKNIGW